MILSPAASCLWFEHRSKKICKLLHFVSFVQRSDFCRVLVVQSVFYLSSFRPDLHTQLDLQREDDWVIFLLITFMWGVNREVVSLACAALELVWLSLLWSQRVCINTWLHTEGLSETRSVLRLWTVWAESDLHEHERCFPVTLSNRRWLGCDHWGWFMSSHCDWFI